jgi:hypothetical protein
MRESQSAADVLPCRHALRSSDINKAKGLLVGLPDAAPEALARAGLQPGDWDMLLRAAIESLRGTSAATTSEKSRFIEAVLERGVVAGVFSQWSFVGTQGRQDYRVELPSGKVVGIEAKGCPDGNNTSIRERPAWADEFVVWCMCPESLANPPGKGVWSGIATRLLMKMTAERIVVDALIFFDGRCGSDLRACPKSYGLAGLRGVATDIGGQTGREDLLPPPCIYLFPRSYPHVQNNPQPRVRTIGDSKFAQALLTLFCVPREVQADYVHEAGIEARGTGQGTEVQVTVVSRCWPDGEPRRHSGRWKSVRRE